MSSYSGGTSGALGGSGSGTSSGSSSGGFPLRANFFRSLALSKDTTEALYQDAKQNAAACLKQSFNEQWRYVPPEKDGTQLRKDTSNLATSCRYVRAATVLRCQEHEVNMVIANTNTESWREFMRKCFGKHYIDTMILHSFTGVSVHANATANATATATSSNANANDLDNNRAHRSASDRPDPHHSAATVDQGQRQTLWLNGPLDLEGDECTQNQSNQDDMDKRRRNSDTQSVPSDDDGRDDPLSEELLTVKWGALDTGGQGKRDLCVVDYLSTATIPNTEPKERVHMWCFSSVEGERVGCMALKDTHGITRTSLSKLGVFWHRVNDEETEVIVCGSFASKHAKYVSAIFLQSLNRLQGIVEDLRLSNQIYIHRSTWVKDHERSSCHLCMRNFYALRRKHHCRRCGEVICSDCSVVENVDLPVIGDSKLRLCKVCCLKAKSTPLKRNTDKSNVFDHLVRARSLSNVNNLSSPNNARMSFADTGSSGSGGGGHNQQSHQQSHYLHNGFGQPQSQSMQPLLNRGAGASGEQAMESTSRSSSSFSSSNTNDFELTDSLEDYTHLHAVAAASHSHENNSANAAAIVHPMSKEMRGLSSATVTTTSSSTTSSTPMLTTQDDDDYDDFIDAKCLNKQLKTMELKQKQKHGGRPTNSNMFDLLCDLACQTLNCPIASVSIVDTQLGDPIRSVTGINDKPELDEELSLFIDKVMGSTPTIVLDANVDKQVTSLFTRRGAPAIRFFAGCPIYNKTGKKLGYICVADFTKRDTLGPSCAFTMERLATLAVTTMEKNLASKQQQQQGERDFFSTPPQPREPITPITPYVTGNFSGAPNNNQTAHFTEQRAPPSPPQPQAQHPAAIFDRPTPGTMPRHRQSSAHMKHVPPPPPPPPSQFHSAAQAYQYHEAYPQPVHARVYDLADAVPVGIGSPVNYSRSAPAPPVAPLPRQYNEYSAGYYEAQERMRKLLIKSYHTQQQLATGSTPNSATPTGVQAAYHAQY